MHVTDWLPTLLQAVKPGLDEPELDVLSQFQLGDLDGLDQYLSFLKPDHPSPRTEMLYNVDPEFRSKRDDYGVVQAKRSRWIENGRHETAHR